MHAQSSGLVGVSAADTGTNQYRLPAKFHRREEISGPVAKEPAAAAVELESGDRFAIERRPRFAALATGVGGVRTVEYEVEFDTLFTKLSFDLSLHREKILTGIEAATDTRLIGDHDQGEAGCPKVTQRCPDATKELNLRRVAKEAGIFDESAISIKKGRRATHGRAGAGWGVVESEVVLAGVAGGLGNAATTNLRLIVPVEPPADRTPRTSTQ